MLMKNIPRILVRTYLRRRPVHIRLARFNFLSRYSWLKNVLEDLKPELFPHSEDKPATDFEPAPEGPSEAVLKLLDEKLQGRQGIYTARRWLRQRGNGHLFEGIKSDTQQTVVIKEYLLPHSIYSISEARERQQAFIRLAGLERPDERSQDIRIIRPLEAIADTQSVERCYLVTDHRDAERTLQDKLSAEGPLPAPLDRRLLAQLLQTLSVLHQQKVVYPSGQVQVGMIHGNLQLSNVLWIEEKGHAFVYLSDFGLWEGIFEPPTRLNPSYELSASAIQSELAAVGRSGSALVTGEDVASDTSAGNVEPQPTVVPESDDPALALFIERLQQQAGAPFVTAEVAWQDLVTLPLPPSPLAVAAGVVEAVTEKNARPRRAALVGAGIALLALMGGGAWLFFKGTEQAVAETEPPVCCLEEVGAIPIGTFTYAAIEGGVWHRLQQQRNLGQVGQSMGSALAQAHSDLNLTYQPAPQAIDAIALVQSGDVDFAILPLPLVPSLPPDLDSRTIAYDGLGVFVSFSYAERNQSIPSRLDGKLTLTSLQAIYLGTTESWRELRGPRLPIARYRSNSPEITAIFEQQVLAPATFDNPPLSDIPPLPTLDMLRTIIQDFESQTVGSVGFAPLSQVLGQCSVYPLALQTDSQPAVQPWILTSGEPIQPTTDLCDRKGLYHPDTDAFQTGDYPLTYQISVVYPKDNRRVSIGQKFAELMQTDEGQYLLADAGLVPLRNLWIQAP